MTTVNARIDLDGQGRGTITVDGVQLRGVRALTLESEAGHVPVLHLELWVHDISTAANPTAVLVPDDTAETLRALGWTPPPGQEVTDAPA